MMNTYKMVLDSVLACAMRFIGMFIVFQIFVYKLIILQTVDGKIR